MEFKLGKNPCPHCTSSDGFHFYGEGNGGFCFVCNHTVLSDEKKAELGVEDIDIEEIMSREPLTKEQIDYLWEKSECFRRTKSSIISTNRNF